MLSVLLNNCVQLPPCGELRFLCTQLQRSFGNIGGGVQKMTATLHISVLPHNLLTITLCLNNMATHNFLRFSRRCLCFLNCGISPLDFIFSSISYFPFQLVLHCILPAKPSAQYIRATNSNEYLLITVPAMLDLGQCSSSPAQGAKLRGYMTTTTTTTTTTQQNKTSIFLQISNQLLWK